MTSFSKQTHLLKEESPSGFKVTKCGLVLFDVLIADKDHAADCRICILKENES